MAGKRTFLRKEYRESDKCRWPMPIKVRLNTWRKVEALIGREITQLERDEIADHLGEFRDICEEMTRHKITSQDIKATLAAIEKKSDDDALKAYQNSDDRTQCEIETALWKITNNPDFPPPTGLQVKLAAGMALKKLNVQKNPGGQPSKESYRLEFARRALAWWEMFGQKDFSASAVEDDASPLVQFATLLLGEAETYPVDPATMAKILRDAKKQLEKLGKVFS